MPISATARCAAESAPLELAGRPVQLRGSALARWLFTRAGWTVRFDGLPARQGVVVVYPHTSNWDLVVGLFAKWSIGLPVAFWGKDTLFRIPLFGRWLRSLGGLPVRRSEPQGAVADAVEALRRARVDDRLMWFALAPEGTRRAGPGWRSGFYRLALGAGVPLGLAALDFTRREVRVEGFLLLSGDEHADMAAIAERLAGARGRRADRAAPVRLIER